MQDIYKFIILIIPSSKVGYLLSSRSYAFGPMFEIDLLFSGLNWIFFTHAHIHSHQIDVWRNSIKRQRYQACLFRPHAVLFKQICFGESICFHQCSRFVAALSVCATSNQQLIRWSQQFDKRKTSFPLSVAQSNKIKGIELNIEILIPAKGAFEGQMLFVVFSTSSSFSGC